METIARSQGFVAQSLLTKAATSTALLGVIEKSARELIEDDFFLLTYSGHGGQVNDVNNGRERVFEHQRPFSISGPRIAAAA